MTENFDNPLTFDGIGELFAAIFNVAIIMLTPIVIFFIIYAGFMYVTARGNSEKITQANNALMYGVIGGVILVGSVAILEIIKNVVDAF